MYICYAKRDHNFEAAHNLLPQPHAEPGFFSPQREPATLNKSKKCTSKKIIGQSSTVKQLQISAFISHPNFTTDKRKILGLSRDRWVLSPTSKPATNSQSERGKAWVFCYCSHSLTHARLKSLILRLRPLGGRLSVRAEITTLLICCTQDRL